MRHLDLFSGIGGFALATEMVWENVEHVFCDNEEFCQKILKKHWPNAPIYGDIRTLTADSYWKRYFHGESEKLTTEARYKAQRKSLAGARSPAVPGIDLLTGGFPCQPFSQAGRRRGTEDNRYLWPEMLRVIQEFHPRWIIGENVAGLVTWDEGMVLDQVFSDLESEGYQTQAFIIPACALDAPHRRDRIWIVGHASSKRRREKPKGTYADEGKNEGRSSVQGDQSASTDTNAANAEHKPARNSKRGGNEKRTPGRTAESASWDEPWLEVAARLCRVDDGLPPPVDRNKRLKALGNAIVPQVAAEVMRAIKFSDLHSLSTDS